MPQNQPSGRGFLLLQRSTAVQVRSSVRLMPRNQPSGRGFLLLQRSTAVQVRSSVRLMPRNQPSGRGLLPSPTAWSPDQHHTAMLADVSRYISGRTEGRGLGFGQLVRTHTGKSLKYQSSSVGLSDYSVLCAGGIQWSAPNWVKVCLVSAVFVLPVSIEPEVETCLDLSEGDRILCLRSHTLNNMPRLNCFLCCVLMEVKA